MAQTHQLKDRDWQNGLKSMIQLCAVCKRLSSNIGYDIGNLKFKNAKRYIMQTLIKAKLECLY